MTEMRKELLDGRTMYDAEKAAHAAESSSARSGYFFLVLV